MTSFLMIGGNASEVVVSSCAKARAGSISHTDSSVEDDTMTRLRGTRAQNRVLADLKTLANSHYGAFSL